LTPIISAGDGYLQWVEVHEESGVCGIRDLTLVHHLPASPRRQKHEHGCQFNSELEYAKDGGLVCDDSLANFCGHDGLTALLAMLNEEKWSREALMEMIKRIHTPNYEYARRHVARASAEGIIESNLPRGFFWQSELRAIMEWQSHDATED
jgi:hypothetical protein